jgi:hypothetical protein
MLPLLKYVDDENVPRPPDLELKAAKNETGPTMIWSPLDKKKHKYKGILEHRVFQGRTVITSLQDLSLF